MRGIALFSLVTLAACASGSGGSSTGVAAPTTTRVVAGLTKGGVGTAASISMNASSTASVTKVAFPLDAVWRALPAAYDSLKIPLTTLDPKAHQVGNEGLKIRQRLGSVALSKYIDCGQAQIGPSADSYDVFLTVMTTVTAPSGAETEIATIVESAAKPLTFAQDYSRCTSKGTIENAISAIVAARLGK
ncbi:MAG TPA: hypothetical protein VGM82_20735 [Gemmatimonadaceae bacterium]